MKRTLTCLALLCATSAFGQTLTNPSFAQNAPVNSWNSGPIPNWKITGDAGLLAIPSLLPSTVPVVAWSNGGTISQDIGLATAGVTYTLTVSVVRRTDGLQNTYTISLGTCSQTGSMSTVPAGTSQNVTLSCAAPGELSVSLACGGTQCDFGGVTLTAGSPPAPPTSVNFTFSGQILINGAAPVGTVSIVQIFPIGTQQVAALTPDASGNVSGTVTLITNFADIVSLNAYNYDAGGNLLNQASINPFPGAMLSSLHGVTGFVLMLNCAIPKDKNGNSVGTVPNCSTAPGTVQGTFQ
jgi:hypothetical protein